MRNLYNEDYTEMDSISSSTLKSRDNIKSQKQTNTDIIIRGNEKSTDVDESSLETRGPDTKPPQEELFDLLFVKQNFSSCSGIALPLASRFVRKLIGCMLHVISFPTFDVLPPVCWL